MYQLLPLLLESLGSEDAGLSQSTLDGLLPLIQDAPGAVSDHVTTLVPSVLALASTPDSMVSCQPINDLLIYSGGCFQASPAVCVLIMHGRKTFSCSVFRPRIVKTCTTLNGEGLEPRLQWWYIHVHVSVDMMCCSLWGWVTTGNIVYSQAVI